MKKVEGWWLPDEDQHIEEKLKEDTRMNRGSNFQTEQRDYSLAVAAKFSKRRRTAIDIGGHVGLWSVDLCDFFNGAIIFEPVPQFRECLVKNLKEKVDKKNYTIMPFALGNKPGAHQEIKLKLGEGNTGDTHIAEDGEVTAEIKRLDNFGFKEIDYIKIDAEGYELEILKGAEWTLVENKPMIVVEIKDKHFQRYGVEFRDCKKHLEDRGYVLENVINSEAIFVHSLQEVRKFMDQKEWALKHPDRVGKKKPRGGWPKE